MKKSLLAPAIEASEEYGTYAVVPSLIGFLIGAAFVYVSDLFLPHDTVEILKPKTTKKEKIETEVISNATNKSIRNRKPKGNLLNKILESLVVILKLMECLSDYFLQISWLMFKVKII